MVLERYTGNGDITWMSRKVWSKSDTGLTGPHLPATRIPKCQVTHKSRKMHNQSDRP